MTKIKTYTQEQVDALLAKKDRKIKTLETKSATQTLKARPIKSFLFKEKDDETGTFQYHIQLKKTNGTWYKVCFDIKEEKTWNKDGQIYYQGYMLDLPSKDSPVTAEKTDEEVKKDSAFC